MGLRNGPSNIKSADFLFHFGNHFELIKLQSASKRLRKDRKNVAVGNLTKSKQKVCEVQALAA